jgi:hypothetical protein
MDLQNKIVAVVGRKGSGKSTIFRKILGRASCLFLLDTMGEHDWIPNQLYTLESVKRFLGWASLQKQFAGSFVCEDEIEPNFDQVANWIYGQGRMTLGIEEVPFFCQPGFLPPGLDRIARLGRHREVSLVYTGQRMAEIARRLTAATDAFILFAQHEPRDLDAIAARCSREVADLVSELSEHGWLAWDAVSREVSTNGKLPVGV